MCNEIHLRHPNYVGECMLWFGLALVCVGGAESIFFDNKRFFVPLFAIAITPLWSVFFLIFMSLMLLEKSAEKRWGGSSEWKRYKHETPVLFPSRFPSVNEWLGGGRLAISKRVK